MRWRLMILSSPINDWYFHEWFSQPIVSNYRDLILLRHQSRGYVEHLFECEICCVHYGLTIVQVILFPWILLIPLLQPWDIHQIKECFSPFSVTFKILFRLFRTWSFTRFTNDLDSIDNSNSASSFPMTNCWGHASSWESTSGRPDLSRGISSFITDCVVPSWKVSSWEKPGRTSCVFLQEVSSGRPDRSYVSRSVFHSWEDQARSSSHFEWLAEKKLSMIVHGNSNQKLSIGSCRCQVIQLNSRDLDYHNFFSPGVLKSRDDTCDGALAIRFITGRDFAVTRSSPDSCWARFDIAAVQPVELKWLILKKHNKWFHSSRVKFPLVRISANWFFGVDVLDLDFWSPSWFDRTTNQAQLCGSWKHVSLWDSFLQWSSWSLLRCPQTHTTKLFDAKTGRLREHNQYSSARWSSLEIFDFCRW